jgi:predicted Zn-ribbon and HTH transcriptional regulator
MFRKDLIPVLLNSPRTLHQISREMQVPIKDVESDLKHLFKSLKHSDYKPHVTPATCRKCQFEFSGEKLHKPSRCPKCRHSWITEPVIAIVSRTS